MKIILVMSLMLSLDNATCERGFSLLNHIKTKKRNILGEQIFYGNKFTFDHPRIAQSIARTWMNTDEV